MPTKHILLPLTGEQFRLAGHSLHVGEYISVTEHDGIALTFRVASVTDWNPDDTRAHPAHA